MNTNARKSIAPVTIALLALTLLPVAPNLQAATITVTSAADSGAGTLRAALASAADGDMINFSLATPTSIAMTSGELLVSKNVSILGPGASNLTVDGNAASGVFRINSNVIATIYGITITNGFIRYPGGGGGIHNDHASLSVSNCVISGNVADVGSCGGGRGGGIYNNHGTLTVSDCTLNGNAVRGGGCGEGRGGAVFNDAVSGNATALFVNTFMSRNGGSAIYNVGSDGGVANLEIIYSVLSSNSPVGGRVIDNEGLNGLATVRLVNSTLSGDLGSVILNQLGTLSISNSMLSDGAILNLARYGRTSIVEIVSSTLRDHTVANYVRELGGRATVRILNSTLSGNTAAPSAGVDNQGFGAGATVEILNSTLSGKRIYNLLGTVDIGSTILDTSGSIFANVDFPGTITSLGYNLSSDDGSGFLTNATDQVNTDPQLGPLQDNGGPTFTHAFVSCSPAIDRGKNFTGFAADQRGLPRAYDDPALANAPGSDSTDIGAFEASAHVPDITPPMISCSDISAGEPLGQGSRVVTFAPAVRDVCDPSPAVSCTPPSGSTFSVGTHTVTCSAMDVSGNSNQCSFTFTVCPSITITVTTTDDSGPGSLRQAILDANDCVGQNIIEFAPSAYGTILLTSGELLLTDELCLNGPGVTNVAVDGNAASRVFHVAPSNTATITGLTITNGCPGCVLADDYEGGGILNDHGTLIVSNVALKGNFGGGGIYSDGRFGVVSTFVGHSEIVENSGGVWNVGYAGSANLVVINSEISRNVGGGILNLGDFGNATVALSNCVLNANSGGSAGAVVSELQNGGTASVVITGCTLSGNSGGSGGAIYNQGPASKGSGSAELQIVNSTLSDNPAGDVGGGLYNYYGSVWITNSTFSRNSAGGAPGGAIANISFGAESIPRLSIANSTFSGNTANGGGCIYNQNGIISLAGTILHGDASSGTISNGSVEAIISLGFNLSSDDAHGFLTNATDQINTDPLLGPLQDNGGPTFTHALLCGSPAIDKGTNFSASAIDQRGSPRPFDRPQNANAPGGDGSDIGAFEVQQFCSPFLSHFGITSNRFGFNLNAEANQLVAIETSTNLTGWTPLATNIVGGSPLRFNDFSPPNLPQRFYRARLP